MVLVTHAIKDLILIRQLNYKFDSEEDIDFNFFLYIKNRRITININYHKIQILSDINTKHLYYGFQRNCTSLKQFYFV